MDKQSQQDTGQQNAGQQELKDIIFSREDGFGSLLRTAREEKNLSLDDVAKELHLNERFIQALESEDYTQLPAAAFVCGYIRNYARLVGIDSEALIVDYKKNLGQETLEPELKILKQAKIREPSLNSTIILLFFKLFLLVVVVFGGWYLWLYGAEYYNNINTITGNTELSVEQSETDINAIKHSVNNDPQSLLLPAVEESSIDKTVSSEIINNSTAPADNSNEVLEVSKNSIEAPIVVAESLPVVEQSLSGVDDSPVSEDALAIDENATSPASLIKTDSDMILNESVEDTIGLNEKTILATANKLVLEFSANCWIKIKDADNKTLSSGTKKTGTILTLEGKRPYDVTIGNANKIKVSIDGQLFDHSAYINENSIARFTLP